VGPPGAPAPLTAILPALLQAQVNLGGDLRTETLARSANLSPSRFHAVFAEAMGETVKQHTLRLRLERSAFRLRTETTGISAIAFDLGFGSHEAFTRAFRDRFRCSPSDYRSSPTPLPHERPERTPGDPGLQELVDESFVSDTQAVQLRATPVAFRRFVGPYDHVSPTAFDDLEAWARQHALQSEGRIGIALDAPGITPTERLRFDVCVVVSGVGQGDATTAFRVLPPRWASSTWYSGPVAHLGAAVAAAFRASAALSGFTVVGLPLEEHYTRSAILDGGSIDSVRILLPLTPNRPTDGAC
jgi:AraC family transcriptional regulator